ncbi:MAG: ribonuclease domain-containing protein [Acutalibacteraceae bacterium]|nr:ribonuclease domain-containing protein [Acutalibacteraceae bacterium]
MSLLSDMITAGIKGILFEPVFYEDKKYKVWICLLSPSTCKPCFDLHGKLFLPEEAPPRFPKLHENCACTVIWSESVKKGTCTLDGKEGVDVLLLNGESLPKRYITKKEAKKLGWKPILTNLHQVTNNGIIGGDIYKNKNGKLPSADGRIWYEADINYTGGMRNSSRVIYSNDGLVFVTYDHYFTFNQIC